MLKTPKRCPACGNSCILCKRHRANSCQHPSVLSVKVNPGTKNGLNVLALDRGVSTAVLLREILDIYLREHAPAQPEADQVPSSV